MVHSQDLTLCNGQKLPALGLGTYISTSRENSPDLVYNAVKEAIRCGYRHFDTAEYYQTEADMGRAVNECIASGLITREEVIIVSKVYRTHMDAGSTAEACRASLKRLDMDYIDIYLIHNPMALDKSLGLTRAGEGLCEKGLFADIDYIETWQALEKLQKEGLVRNIGVSNFSGKQIQRILDAGLTKPVCNQVEVSPYCPNTKLIEYCQSRSIAVVGYCPLGSPARSSVKEGDKALLEDPTVLSIAEKTRGKTPAQVVLRWAIQKGLGVIPKSYTPHRQRDNSQIFDFELSTEDMHRLDNIGHHYRCCDFLESIKHPHYPLHDE